MTKTSSYALTAVLVAGAVARGTETLEVPALSLSPASFDAQAMAEQKPTNPPTANFGVSGDWFGTRSALGEQKIFFEGFALLDVSKNFRGGIDTENYAVRYLLDLHFTVDASAFGVPGGMMYVDLQAHDQTENRDSIVGDIQAYDNLEGPRYVSVQQVWWKQDLGNDFRLKIGRIDANADAGLPEGEAIDGFSLLEHGREFLHSAASLQPTIFVMPTYPNPAPGAALFYGKGEGFYAGGGVYWSNARNTFLNISGHPETAFGSTGGVFLIAEAGARWTWDGKPGHAGAGGWYHTGNFHAARDPEAMHRGAGGGYLLVDQRLYQEGEGEAVGRTVGGFFTAGVADPGADPITQQVALGFTAKGFVPGRANDSFGVMSSWVGLARPVGEPTMRPGEWATEGYYRLRVTEWASVTPSLDYIVSPSGRHPDAWVGTVRIEVNF